MAIRPSSCRLMCARFVLASFVSFTGLAPVAGCSPQNVLDRPRAAKLIRESERFKTPDYQEIAVGGFCYPRGVDFVREVAKEGHFRNDPARSFLLAASLESAGLTQVSDLPSRNCEWTSSGVQVVLTPGGQERAKQWKEQQEGDHVVYEVPMIRRELIEITGITVDSDRTRATVEFSYKVIQEKAGVIGPVPAELTKALAEPRKGTAAFKLYDDGWRLKEINVD
jgi:hypothetical protein